MPLAAAFTDPVERTQPDAEVDHLPLQVWREDFHAERIAQRRGREMHEARELAGVCGQHVRLHRGHIAIAGEQFVRTVAHPGRPYAAFAEGAQSQILHSGVPQLHRVEAPQDGDHVGHGFEQRLVASPDNVVLETQSSPVPWRSRSQARPHPSTRSPRVDARRQRVQALQSRWCRGLPTAGFPRPDGPTPRFPGVAAAARRPSLPSLPLLDSRASSVKQGSV